MGAESFSWYTPTPTALTDTYISDLPMLEANCTPVLGSFTLDLGPSDATVELAARKKDLVHVQFAERDDQVRIRRQGPPMSTYRRGAKSYPLRSRQKR